MPLSRMQHEAAVELKEHASEVVGRYCPLAKYVEL